MSSRAGRGDAFLVATGLVDKCLARLHALSEAKGGLIFFIGRVVMFSRMRNALVVVTLLLVLFAVGPSIAVASVTIRNTPPTRHFAPPETPLVDLAAAIRRAAIEQGWQIVAEAPGAMRASLHVRSHEAVVTIGFDETNFWIDYDYSINLDYNPNTLRKTRNRGEVKGPRIHRNYNIWVDQLTKKIAIYAKVPPKATLTEPAPSKNPILIADELEKLDALRQRGVLSQEEFDQQKAKLLAH
jgi:hypothetical protein